jgi:hypothetical protein
MPTNNNINYGPAPLPGTEPSPVLGNNIDQAPAAVAPGPGLGINPASSRESIILQTEQPVQTPLSSAVGTGPNITAGNQQRYITILANGTVVTNNASSLNFVGDAVSVANLGTTGANIVVTMPGAYNNANVVTLLAGFGSNTVSTTGNITAGNVRGNIQAADGNGSVQFNINGILGASSGFNYQSNSGALFSKSINGSGDPVSGTGAIYGGLGSGYTQLGSTVLAQLSGNVNSYAQLNLQNVNNGNSSSADYIITANNGTDTTYYLDLGLAGNNHADPAFFGDTSTKNDGYLYINGASQSGPGGGVGNLILGSTNGVIKMFVGNTAQANVAAIVSTGGLSVSGNITGGNLSAVGRVLVGNGSPSVPSYGFTSDGAIDTGFYWVSDGNIGVTNNGVRSAQFYPTGVFGQVPTTIGNLPPATTAGLRAFVTDSNKIASGNYGAIVATGGSNTVSVFSNGSNWLIG